MGDLTVDISGPTQIPYYQPCTWDAYVSGGLPPYSYSWSGVTSGSGATIYGGDFNGLLYLDVSSHDDQEDGASLYISTSEEGSC